MKRVGETAIYYIIIVAAEEQTSDNAQRHEIAYRRGDNVSYIQSTLGLSFTCKSLFHIKRVIDSHVSAVCQWFSYGHINLFLLIVPFFTHITLPDVMCVMI